MSDQGHPSKDASATIRVASPTPLDTSSFEALISTRLRERDRARSRQLLSQVIAFGSVIVSISGLIGWLVITTLATINEKLALAREEATSAATKVAQSVSTQELDRFYAQSDTRVEFLKTLNKQISDTSKVLVEAQISAGLTKDRGSGLLDSMDRLTRLLDAEKERIRAREADLDQISSLSKVTQTLNDIRQDVVRTVVGDSDFRRAVANITGTVPSGFVAAFTNSSGCPAGWSLYADAVGRFVIGAGVPTGTWQPISPDGTLGRPRPLTRRTFHETGGEEMHQLSLEEMPAHNHGGLLAGTILTQALNPGGTNSGPAFAKPIETQGGNHPHNIIPPFIALTYCVRS